MSGPASRRLRLSTGLSYHVLEWGAETEHDHTVVLVHGFLDNAWGWQRTVESGLAGHFHLVCPDMRGHGDSDRVGAGGYYHFLDYVADLADLIAQVGRTRVSVVGHSMGGTIAAYWAGTFPDALHRLALLEGLGPPEPTTAMPERVRAWLRGWARVADRGQRSYADVAEAAGRLRANDSLLDEALALELAGRGTRPLPDGRVVFKHDPLHATSSPYPFRVELARQFWTEIRCPVLLVDGAESVFRHAEKQMRPRRAAFADANHIVLPGAGHMMQRHQPAALAEALRGFLG